MASDAGGGGMGGAADRPGRSETSAADETGRVENPWRRIETERPERDRASRAHDASHDPSEVFEKSHLSLPERDRSPGRFTVEDFTPEQRAELEDSHGRPLEEILASRDRAFEAEQQRKAEAPPPPDLDGYRELPGDDTANHIVRDYREGYLSYDAATRRLDLLGHQPRPITQAEQAKPPDQTEQPGRTEQGEREEPHSGPEVQAPSDHHGETAAGEPAEAGDTPATDGTGDGGDDGNDHPAHDHPDDNDPSDQASDRGLPPDVAERCGRIATDLREGNLTPEEAADQLDQLRNTNRNEQPAAPENEQEPDSGSSSDDATTYDNPSEVREAMLAGKSVTQIRRELIDQPDASTTEPTAHLMGEDGDYRYEKGTAPDDTVGFGALVTDERTTDDAIGSRASAGVDDLSLVADSRTAERDGPDRSDSGPSMARLRGLDHRLHQLEAAYKADFEHLVQDPDHNGRVKPDAMDEARVALDLRAMGKVPADIQRPPVAGQGDLYSPSTGQHYDIKGVHSDWPPLSEQRDRSRPYKQAYDPNKNEKWVTKLEDQIRKQRIVILDLRNADQAAIEDVRAIVQNRNWSDRVVWYP